MSDIFKRIEKIQDDAKNGVLNFMPFNLKGFSKVVPGMITEPQIVTASTSGGKSSIVKFLYVFKGIQYAIENNINYKILFFALEDNLTLIQYSILIALYWEKYKEILDIRLLEGMKFNSEGKVKTWTVDQEKKIKTIENSLVQYMTYITVVDDIYSSNEIFKETKKWASRFGKYYFENTEVSVEEINNGAKWDNYKKHIDMFGLVVVDHVSLLNNEKEEKTLFDSIKNMSKIGKQYIVKKLGFPFLMVQQQSEEKTNLDHIKSNYFLPTEQGLADYKATGKDSRMTLGITAPFKFQQKTYRGYDLELMRGYYRCINIIKQTFGEVGNVFDFLFIPQCNYFYLLPKIKKGEKVSDETQSFINVILEKIKNYEDL